MEVIKSPSIFSLIAFYLPNIIGGIISIAGLKFFYEFAELQWPNYYFSQTEKVNYYASITPHRFFLFRFLPLAIAIFPVISFLSNYGKPMAELIITGLLVGLFHACSTNGKAFVRILKNSKDVTVYFNKPTQLATHFVIFLFCIITSVLVAYCATTPMGRYLAPDWEGVRDNVWSSVLVISLSVFVYKKYTADIDVRGIFQKTTDDIGDELNAYIDRLCAAYNADRNLFLSIYIAESIQRPKWLRYLERFKGLFYPTGTYGVMQVKSEKPISDLESIEISIRERLKGTANLTETEKNKMIELYNPSQAFQSWAKDAYQHLAPPLPIYEETDGGSQSIG